MDIQKRLIALADTPFRDFNAKLIPTVDKKTVIGIKTPLLKQLAKELVSTGEHKVFLDDLPHTYFEENQLHAFIISEMKDFDDVLGEVIRFLPFVDNWATCDQMVPRAFAKQPEAVLEQVESWLKSGHVYTVRFAMGHLMRYFLDARFDNRYHEMVAAVTSNEYYINMMAAWYFATALAKQYDATLPYLQNECLTTWVHNKTIQKARESYRVIDAHKAELKNLVRRSYGMNVLLSLCRELKMPDEVITALKGIKDPPDETLVRGLLSRTTFESATKALLEYEDRDGMEKLHVMLSAAVRSREKYIQRGIPNRIYLDTFGCFKRFIGEYKASYGTYAFDRAFWCGRQTSLSLFRLGALEYEMIEEGGLPMISIHIPSDASLTPMSVDASLAEAEAFFNTFEPMYGNVPYVCHSWLLSPALEDILPVTANLIQFRRRFDIGGVHTQDESYKMWVFGDPRLAPCDFAENTTLQRGIKQFVLGGGKVGSAYGTLKK